MILSRLLSRMTAYSNGNFHDINHFLKVWAYARAIGLQEQLPPEVRPPWRPPPSSTISPAPCAVRNTAPLTAPIRRPKALFWRRNS